MSVRELIDLLQGLDQDCDVFVLDDGDLRPVVAPSKKHSIVLSANATSSPHQTAWRFAHQQDAWGDYLREPVDRKDVFIIDSEGD